MQKNYFDKVHKWGILWNFGAILVLLLVPVVICIDIGAWPDSDALKVVMPKLMGLYWLTAIVEVITYVPLLGAGGEGAADAGQHCHYQDNRQNFLHFLFLQITNLLFNIPKRVIKYKIKTPLITGT